MKPYSDYLLQKYPERAKLYEEHGGIWWSTEIKRWMVSHPLLLAEVMESEDFAVPSYDVGAIRDRLNIDLAHLDKLRAHFPLAAEGEAHVALRQKMAREIAANTAGALERFERKFAQALSGVQACASGSRFCLVRELFQPALKDANLRLAGINDDVAEDIEAIPQLFDDTISLKARINIDAIVGRIAAGLPADMGPDERYFRTAIVALNANTLLGSILQSFVATVSAHPGMPLAAMPWAAELPATGLPLIEKKAVRDTTLGGHAIKKGDRLRLFVEAGGYRHGQGPSYSDLYFAVGPHQCPGKSFSRQIWKLAAKHLSGVDRKIALTHMEYRSRDHVFNLYQRLEAEFDA